MARETKTITTPSGHAVVLNAYLTGREVNELKAMLFADLKLSTDDIQSGKVAVEDIPASFLVKQEEKAIELLVVSFDGASENAVQAVLDLPSAEYQLVVDEINAIRNPTMPAK